MWGVSPVFGLFCYLGTHFLEVEGYGKEGKVHCDLVFSKVTEASVCHVGFHLSENGFRFNASSPSVPDSVFGSKKFAGRFLVLVEPVVDFNNTPVTFGFVALASQRAAFAVLCAVSVAFASVAAGGLGMGGADAGHMLAHRTDVIVLLGVIMETVVVERIGPVARTLFEMEAVVLDVRLHTGLIHETVVFFRAVTGIGNNHRGQTVVALEEGVEEGNQGQRVGGVGKQGEIGDELVFG